MSRCINSSLDADGIYFAIIDHLNIWHLCIEDDPDGGTRNTEYGRDLYFMIDDLFRGEVES